MPNHRSNAANRRCSGLFGLSFRLRTDTDLIHGKKHLKRKTRTVLLMIGPTENPPHLSRAELARSLLTMITGQCLSASPAHPATRSNSQISL